MCYTHSMVNKNITRKMAWFIAGIAIIVISSLGGDTKLFGNDTVLSNVLDSQKSLERILESGGDKKVVLLKIEGIIADTDGGSNPLLSSTMVSVDHILEQIQQAEDDPTVVGLIIEINSPGGTVTASNVLAERLKTFKLSEKKIVVRMREVTASGGYYIASQADKIVANPSTLTGSIGVIFETTNLQELYKKIGYQPIVLKAGKYKDIGSANRAMTDEERDILQKIIDEDYDDFVTYVADGRKMDKAKVLDLAQGKIYSGRQAKEVNLIDELGNFDKAVEVAKQITGITDLTIVEYYSPLSFLSNLGSITGSAVISQVVGKLTNSAPARPQGMLYLWDAGL